MSESIINVLENYLAEIIEAFQATNTDLGDVNIPELASFGMFPMLFATMPPFVQKKKEMEDFCMMIINKAFASFVKPACEKYGYSLDLTQFNKLVWDRYEMYAGLHIERMSRNGPNFPGVEDDYSKFIELFTGNPTTDSSIMLATVLQTKYTDAFVTISNAIIESNPLKNS